MKPLTYIVLLLSSATILFFSCHPQHSNSEWIQLADEQASKSTDSLETLLNNVERPLELKGTNDYYTVGSPDICIIRKMHQ